MRFIGALVCLLLAIAGPLSAAPADLGTVRFAWSPGPDVPQVALSLDKGLWKQRGLTVQASNVATGREALETLIGGQADFASMAEFPVVVGAMQAKSFKVIAVLSRYTANRVIGTTANPLSSIKDLAGKKVGTTLGTNANYQADLALADAGVTTATLVNVAPADLTPALARGDIDAAVMFPSFFPLAKKVLGDKYRDLKTPEYATTFLIVATTDVIEQHPDRVKAFLSALLAANTMLASNRADSAASVATNMGGLATPDAISALWGDYKFDVTLDGDALGLLMKEGAWVHKQGLVKGPEPTQALIRSYFATEPLRALAPKNVTLK